MTHDRKTIRIARGIVVAVALSIPLVLPAIYFTLGYWAMSSAATTKAEVKAEAIARIIEIAPEYWVYQDVRLAELLARYPRSNDEETWSVLDHYDRLVAVAGPPTARFALARSAVIQSVGSPIARVEVSRPLRRLIERSALVGAIAVFAACLVYWLLEHFAVAALQRAFEELRHAKERAEESSRALAVEKEQAEVTLHCVGDAVVTTNAQGFIRSLNPVAERLTAWSQLEASGRRVSEILSFVHETTGEPVGNPVESVLAERRAVALTQRVSLKSANGALIAIEYNAAPIIDSRRELIGSVIVFHDVRAARDMASRLSWQASHDPLTGLVNRHEFENRLNAALASASDTGKRHALCYLDLDQFKIVNDTSGHAAGDALLKQFSAELQPRVRDTDTLARLGGDEFGLLLENCPASQARMIADGLIERVRSKRFAWEGKTFNIGVSIGITEIGQTTASINEALSAADTACYTAKERGGGQVHVCDIGDEQLSARRAQMNWVSRIQKAIENRQLVLYGQRYLSVKPRWRNTVHIELLLRMKDGDAIILPGQFLPAAERYSLMPAVDRAVISSAFIAIPQLLLRFAGGHALFAINLSGASLNSDTLVSFIRDEAEANGIDASNVCFEITETSALSDIERTASFMRELKTLGFRFSLDDFGTGMSSFLYLKRLPVDFVKIAGNFVREMPSDPVSRSMVASINEMGHLMGLATVAECAETAEIVDELRDMGVDFIQGYAVGRPLPLHRMGQPQLRLVSGDRDAVA